MPEQVVFPPLVDPTPLFAWSMLSHPGSRGLDPLRATIRELAHRERWLEP